MFSGIPQPYVIDIYVFYFEKYMPGYLERMINNPLARLDT